MSNHSQTKLTLATALRDLGWFSGVFSALVGGPSVLDLLQAIFEYRFVAVLQRFVDGYRQLTAQLAALVEPAILPVIEWLNATLDWRLMLYEHWRPLFLLALVYTLATTRASWHHGRRRGAAILGGVSMCIGSLIGALLSGALPLSDVWWQQGVIAAAPVLSLHTMLGLAGVLHSVATGRSREAGRWLFGALRLGAILAATAFALGVVLALVSGLEGSGILALFVLVVLWGAVELWTGLGANDLRMARIGLTMLGGFFTAAVLLLANQLIVLLA